MKKSISGLFVAALIPLILFTSTCKKTDEAIPAAKGIFVISNGIGNVKYFHYENLTFMVMKAVIFCQNEIGGAITSWKFIFKSVDRTLLEINDTNYSSYALYADGQLRISENTVGLVNASYADESHDNFSPFQGRLFDVNPTAMDIFITVTDDNAYIQTFEFHTSVTYDIY